MNHIINKIIKISFFFYIIFLVIVAAYSYYLFVYETPCGRTIEGTVYDKQKNIIKNYKLSIEYIETTPYTIKYDVKTNDKGYYKLFFKGDCRVRISAPNIQPTIYHLSCGKQPNRKIKKDFFIEPF